MITVYGIPNGNTVKHTVKRARACLAARGVEHRVHDFKRDGVALDCAEDRALPVTPAPRAAA